MLGSAVGKPGDESRFVWEDSRTCKCLFAGAARILQTKEEGIVDKAGDRVICWPSQSIKRSSDSDQVVRDRHSGLRACLNGAGGIGVLSVHRVSRVHCSPACASRPTQQGRLPRNKMRQATRAHAGLDRKWYQGLFKRGAVSALGVKVA